MPIVWRSLIFWPLVPPGGSPRAYCHWGVIDAGAVAERRHRGPGGGGPSTEGTGADDGHAKARPYNGGSD